MLHVEGSCHCEQIKFEAEVDTTKVTICHCTDCQKLTGAPFRVVVPVAKGYSSYFKVIPKLISKRPKAEIVAFRHFVQTADHQYMLPANLIKKCLGLELAPLNKELNLSQQNRSGITLLCHG